ncbi:leucine-rich repeat domain-containing protein, partial [Prevotella sp.]|uniref:leucine-rich repeat domain-containing protein n=1 Tax=Prevotella sp. TaxID=59823 RepID=UPI004028158A
DQGSGTLVEKDVALDNDINGFVRPINLKVQPSGGNMVFSWEQEGYNPSASTEGKWIVYKREGDNNVKVGEVAVNEQSLSIEKKQYSCSKDYIITFLPNACEVEESVCGLTTPIAATGHKPNADDICQICGHSFFRYQTSDGKIVDISKRNFGAKVVAHEVVDGKCVIEFDAPITKIPMNAFRKKKLTGNLVIPNSITTIEKSAFYGCTGLSGNLTIPNSVTTIGESAFLKCSGFTGNLTIPNSVTTIGNFAFSYCIGFTGDLSLPKSLEVVGSRSFEFCNKIQTIKFQSLPEGISGYLGVRTKKVSLSDDSYISDKATGTVNAISYTRTMTSNWGTLVLPYSMTLTGNEPYRLYAIDNMTGDELVLKQLNGEVAAGTPCVVKRKGSEAELTFSANNAELNMAINDQPMDGMNFSGTYWTKDVTNGYIIAKDCFWNVEELKNSSSVKGVKVNPFRAWLDGTSANAPAQFSMRIDDSTTGINAIDALNDAEADYYDLSGKRLNEPQRGVNIVRMKSGKTKKIIIK